MKSERIINSWDKVNPDEAAHERMLSNILARSSTNISSSPTETEQKEKVLPLRVSDGAHSKAHNAKAHMKRSIKSYQRLNNKAKIVNILASVAVFALAIVGVVAIYIASGGPAQDPVNTGVGIGIESPGNEPDITQTPVETPTETSEHIPEPPDLPDVIVGDDYYTTVMVNVRSRASTSSEVIGILEKGIAVEVVEVETNGWTKISYGDTTGYIRSDLLSSSMPDKPVQAATVIETTVAVNVRSSPSVTAEVLIILEAGSVVNVLEDEKDGWIKVNVDDITGYIRSEYVS